MVPAHDASIPVTIVAVCLGLVLRVLLAGEQAAPASDAAERARAGHRRPVA
jgi:hypothetical protein